jgi:hypothetical protein
MIHERSINKILFEEVDEAFRIYFGLDAAYRFEEEGLELVLKFFLLVENLKVVYDHPFEYCIVINSNLTAYLLTRSLCLCL